jgi:hypothetical protein
LEHAGAPDRIQVVVHLVDVSATRGHRKLRTVSSREASPGPSSPRPYGPARLGQALAANQVDEPRNKSEDAGTRPLDRIGRSSRLSRLAQLLQVADVVLHPTLNRLELGDDLGVILQVLDLARDRLVEVLLERQHVGDITVDGVFRVAHALLQKARVRVTHVHSFEPRNPARELPPRCDE